MKKVKVRNDLMSKKEFSVKYGMSRPLIDRMINRGEIPVEHICGIDYIRINKLDLNN